MEAGPGQRGRVSDMITYLAGIAVAGWLLSGMPGAGQLRPGLLQSLSCLRTSRFWLLLALLALPAGALVFLALLWAGRALWTRAQETPDEKRLEAEGIGISPCE